jgi:hypothetical protein
MDFRRLLSNLKANNNLIHKQADLREFANNAQERRQAAQRFRTQQEEELLRRRVYLQSWLPAADMESDHERHVAARRGDPRSGRWVFSRREFSDWLHSTTAASSFLWIHGVPGAGKHLTAMIPPQMVRIAESNKQGSRSSHLLLSRKCFCSHH